MGGDDVSSTYRRSLGRLPESTLLIHVHNAYIEKDHRYLEDAGNRQTCFLYHSTHELWILHVTITALHLAATLPEIREEFLVIGKLAGRPGEEYEAPGTVRYLD
jgi:hypothetical protein